MQKNNTILLKQQHQSPAILCFDVFGHVADFRLQGRHILGRASGDGGCDFVIPSQVISRTHGEFGVVEGKCFYRDLCSSNGTWINGERCGSRPHRLQDGDVLTFLPHRLERGIPDVVVIFVSDCPDHLEWREIPLTQDISEITVGRESGEIRPDDAAVSKKHASFFQGKSGWCVIDHQSTNGVFLNGRRICAPEYLKPMDMVRIANTWYVNYGSKLIAGMPEWPDLPKQKDALEESREAQQLVIEIQERNVWSRFRKKSLLKDINLTVEKGNMVLILGGSGAGKTTFMNAVMGYEKAEGTISYGDTDIYEEYERMKYDIGFVPQQDLLRGSDTVYDTLYNAAQMKMPSGTGKSGYENRVETVLELLGLEREKETLVVKLSGGQRKRLSIATEFAGDPELFFLDEPDSGLDGVMARGLMENLRHIADLGKIVMVITHGPDRAADLFDKVIVLAKSTEDDCGHLAFYGTTKRALDFFETKTLEGIVRRINRADEGGEGLADHFIRKFAEVWDE